MGRISKDHSGWRSHGLYLKYQQPSVEERPPKPSNKKKDTNKWCRGKVGTKHNLHQKLHFRLYRKTYYTTKCYECGKEFYKKRVKSLPLHIEVKRGASSKGFPVQVKVNGRAVPIDSRLYDDNSYYCEQCEQWHY